MADNDKQNGMSPESLQLFAAGLKGLDANEVAKAKELYLRNAITEYHSELELHKNNYFTMALHLLIPIFWPMLFGSQRQNKIRMREQRGKIENAMLVWKEDILQSYDELYALLHSRQSSGSF